MREREGGSEREGEDQSAHRASPLCSGEPRPRAHLHTARCRSGSCTPRHILRCRRGAGCMVEHRGKQACCMLERRGKQACCMFERMLEHRGKQACCMLEHRDARTSRKAGLLHARTPRCSNIAESKVPAAETTRSSRTPRRAVRRGLRTAGRQRQRPRQQVCGEGSRCEARPAGCMLKQHSKQGSHRGDCASFAETAPRGGTSVLTKFQRGAPTRSSAAALDADRATPCPRKVRRDLRDDFHLSFYRNRDRVMDMRRAQCRRACVFARHKQRVAC